MLESQSASVTGNIAEAVVTANAKRIPDQVALTYCGSMNITFGELNAAVNRRAHSLAELGVKPGMRAVVLLHKVIRAIDLYLALAKIGAVLLPADPYWTDDAAVAAVGQAGCAAFIYDTPHEKLVSRLRPRLPTVRRWIRLGSPAEECSSCDGDTPPEVIELDPLTAAAPAGELTPGAGPGDPLVVLYDRAVPDSPRAVVHTHGSCLAIAHAWRRLPRAPDAALGTGPDILGARFVTTIAPALAAGLRVVLENNLGLARAAEVIARERVSHLHEPTAFTAGLLAQGQDRGIGLSSLRILLTGEPVPPALRRALARRLPDAAFYTHYGPLEAPYICLCPAAAGGACRYPGGCATNGAAVRVIGSAGEHLVGEPGEVEVAGPQLMAGYLGGPAGDTGHWLRTGDIGELDGQGVLSVLGPRAGAISRGSRWVLPAALEAAACSINGIARAAAVGIAVDADEQRVVLAVEVEPGTGLTGAELTGQLTAGLPPGQWPDIIVIADEVPGSGERYNPPSRSLRRVVRERYERLP